MELFLFYFFATVLILAAYMVISNTNSVHSVLYLVLVFCINSCILLLLGSDFLALLLLVVYIGAIAILFLFVVMLLPIKRQKTFTFFQDLPLGLLIGLVLCLFVILLIGLEIPDDISKPQTIARVKEKFMPQQDIVENLKKYTDELIAWGRYSRIPDKALNIMEHALKHAHPIIIVKYHYEIPSEMTHLVNFYKGQEIINLMGAHLYGHYFYTTLFAGLILLLALISAVVLAGKNKKIKNQLVYQQLSRRAETAILKIN